MFCQKVVLKYFSKFTGKSLSWSLLFESCKLKAGRFIWVCMSIFKYIPAIFTVYTAWKVSKCRGFSSPYFPLSELNTEIYGVNLFISVQIQEKTDQKKLRIFFAQCYLNFCFYFNFEFLKNFHTALFYKINKFFSRNIYKSIFLGGTAQQKLCYMKT